MRTVLVLNASYEELSLVDWQRAVVLVTAGSAEIVESFPDRVVRSTHMAIPWPKVIMLTRYVYVRWHPGLIEMAPSKGNILARDLSTCAYCAGYADTVDHILPKSRGGPDSWLNQIAACAACNQDKADRTPEEAGMKLLWEPYVFDNDKARRRRLKQLGIKAVQGP